MKRVIIVLFILLLLFSYVFPVAYFASESNFIRYEVHLKDKGWSKTMFNGEIAGTTGESRRMEAISIALGYIKGKIYYKVHCQDYGWLGFVPEGNISGTTGESKRMEAIIINFESNEYEIKYRVHVQDYGWMNWVSSGQVAGTTGQSKRIEAIQIKLERKNTISIKSNNIDLKNQTVSEISNIKNEVNVETNINNKNENNTQNSNLNKNETNIDNTINNGTDLENKVNNKENNNIKNNETNFDNSSINNNEDNINNKNEMNIENTNIIKNGIDVSKYQGKIDWNKVKASGIEFAMIRCGYRGYTAGGLNEDEWFYYNVKNAYANNVKVGLYFYSSAVDEKEGMEEANYVLDLINKYNFKNIITHPIAFDVEDFEGTRSFNLTIDERTKVTNAFCSTIEKSGFIPMIYSYTYFLDTKLNMNNLKNYKVWIADYYGNTWYKGSFDMWQYTSKGKIDGILGDVDLNYLYVNY